MASVAAIVCDPAASAATLLDRALDLAGLRAAATARIGAALAERGACSAVLVPAMDAFALDSPAAADPRLVEHLLDVLFDLGVTEAVVGSTRATAALWLENRDVFVAADLLGYRYETARGRPYDVVDLAEDAEPGAFPAWGPLAGTSLSRAWRDADLRVVVSANRTDDDEGYALCLSTLLSVLPLTDKDYHYRYRRDAGEVVAQLLAAAPVHLAVIDAVVSGHGAAGGRRPIALATGAVIAASEPALADYVGALKMGLDPFVSGLAAPALRRARAAPDLCILGSLEPYPGWVNAPPALVASTAARRSFVTADRALRPALQQVDRDLFPFRHAANDWLNGALADVAATGETGVEGAELLTLTNLLVADLEKAGSAWSVNFDKDRLRRRDVPLDVDPASLARRDYEALRRELAPQLELLRGVPADAGGVRWRFDDGAVVFDGARRFPLPYDAFTAATPIHRTIQFMNDYVGGCAEVTARDRKGRVIRQLERNLYLPQPNYTALGGGVTIDVTKIELVDYAPDRQRMFWKTLHSANGSALVDDGVVTFERAGPDTLVTIWGRQQFVLPPLWAAIDRQLAPTAKRALVDAAYGRFFDRTFANLEAVAEGRDVRLGRPWTDASEGEPLPVEWAEDTLKRFTPKGGLDLTGIVRSALGRDIAPAVPARIDADGFRHFQAPPLRPLAEPAAAPAARLLRDLGQALRIDTGRTP